MKKFITSSLILLTCAFSAQAELLYFLVNSYSSEGPKYNFDWVKVGVAYNDGKGWNTDWGADGAKVYLDIKIDDNGGTDDKSLSNPAGPYTEAGPSSAIINADYTADSYAFYIETYKVGTGGEELIWGFDESTAKSYTQLKNYIYQDNTSQPSGDYWVAVPEPTSGMLLLLGIAGLALRRRRGDSASRVSRLATSHEVRT